MGYPEVAAGAFVKAGVKPNELLALVNDAEVTETLRANANEAVRRDGRHGIAAVMMAAAVRAAVCIHGMAKTLRFTVLSQFVRETPCGREGVSAAGASRSQRCTRGV
jgi:hypothetical protein